MFERRSRLIIRLWIALFWVALFLWANALPGDTELLGRLFIGAAIGYVVLAAALLRHPRFSLPDAFHEELLHTAVMVTLAAGSAVGYVHSSSELGV